ncbi:MAG: PAS domain-containing protein [Nitrospirae bacterium]|nr:PAS domain-containing protein [Nitrospirota bacterium]
MHERESIKKDHELSRFFFINSVVRSGLDLNKVLRIVLTEVTMGDGLGFNRAILFLVDEAQDVLKGIMGVGPSSLEDARNIWSSLKDKSFETIIREIETGSLSGESYLDKVGRNLSIKLDGDCICCNCINEKRPFNVADARTDDRVKPLVIQLLGTNAFGVVPLISRDKVIGLIWVDNLFTGKPIRDEDLQFLMEFTSHIAPAIENARLFEKVSLAQSELRNIFESIADMVYFTDKDYTIRRINKAVLERIGRPEEEIIGRKCYEVFHGKSRPWERCPHLKTISSKRPAVEEIEDPYLGGTFVLSNSPISDPSGNFIGTVHISRDITELHDLREKLTHAEKMAVLGELTAVVAHEIRKPLVSIGGFARRLEKKLAGDTSEYAKIIINEAGRLENILKEILGFAKGSKLIKSSVNVNEVVKDIIDFIVPEIETGERGNRLIRDIPEAPIITVIDRDKIKEAMLNLLTNADDATDHGTITIKIKSENDEAVIEISDTGSGIKPENLNDIFNPFFTTKSGGIGLGLAITRRIIEEHNGRIEVESELGLGTAFRIHLPLKET